jgi:hypothetical protein
MKRYTLVPKMNPDTHKFITKKVISKETVLNYLIIIPCVNRLERNAVNIIERTFQSFENGGVFTSKIKYDLFCVLKSKQREKILKNIFFIFTNLKIYNGIKIYTYIKYLI